MAISVVLGGVTYSIPSKDELDWSATLNRYLIALATAVNAVAGSHVRASTAAAQSMADGVPATIIFGTQEYDTGSEYDPATGIFTAASAGYYVVSAACLVAAYAVTGSDNFQLYLGKNGNTPLAFGTVQYGANGVTMGLASVISTTIHLAAADTIKVIAQLVGDTKPLAALATANYFTVDRIA